MRSGLQIVEYGTKHRLDAHKRVSDLQDRRLIWSFLNLCGPPSLFPNGQPNIPLVTYPMVRQQRIER